jgi:cell pole-organizing protein PopZ
MTASAQRAAEPSMEEILASIRRIIADDKSRTRIGPAKLVSVSEPPAEKPVAAAPAAEFHRPDTEPARAPVDEAQTFGEGREAFSVAAPPEGEGARLAELEAPPSLPEKSASLVEESSSAIPSPSLNLFGGINPLRPIPHDAHALSMPAPGEASRRAETQGARSLPAQSLPAQSLPDDSIEAAPEPLGEIESAQTWDADAPLSRAPSPQPEIARQRPQPEVFPDLSSPSPRLAQACADEREAAQIGGLAGPRPQSRRQEAASILSNEADRAVTRAFGDLNRGVLSQNVRSLEDVVQEMLRPMLKAWLDDNLHRIVERLVRMEIERVARGRPE